MWKCLLNSHIMMLVLVRGIEQLFYSFCCPVLYMVCVRTYIPIYVLAKAECVIFQDISHSTVVLCIYGWP